MDALIRVSIVSDFNIEDIIAFNGSVTKVKATGEVDIGLEYVDWRRKSLVIPNLYTIGANLFDYKHYLLLDSLTYSVV